MSILLPFLPDGGGMCPFPCSVVPLLATARHPRLWWQAPYCLACVRLTNNLLLLLVAGQFDSECVTLLPGAFSTVWATG